MERPITYEGRALKGVGELGKLLDESTGRALYELDMEGSDQPSLIEIRRADRADSEARLLHWRELTELKHLNLLQNLTCGESILDGVPVVYVVSEYAEESLAGVLRERALSEQEAREMLQPVLSVLAYLHNKGYTHSALVPEQIFAVGNTLKVGSAGVQRSDAKGTRDDMRAVGVLLVQALTRKSPEMEEISSPYILREASEPLSGIVRHCLETDPAKRWTAEQALAYLSDGENALHQPTPHADLLDITKRPALLASIRPGNWIYGVAAAAFLIVIAGVGLTGRKKATPKPIPVVAVTPNPAVPDSVTRILPAASGPAHRSKAVVPPQPTIRSSRNEGWAVIVASYGARGAAEKRARDFGSKWPRFHVEIFQPPSQRTRHLVVIGRNLSESKAEALRKRARASGLPRDTYIKRFD